MSVNVKWIGNAFFMIKSDDKLIFTDPWVTNNPGVEVSVEDCAAMKPTHVLVSHGHPGHYGRGDSIAIANLAKTTYYTTKEVLAYVMDKGLIHTSYLGFEPGSRIKADGVDIEMFSVVHPPEPPVAPEWKEFSDRCAAPNTINIIQVEGKTILHVGDTTLSPAYEDIAKRYKVDIALLPLWGKGMAGDAPTAISIVKSIINIVKPKYVMFHNRWDPERPAWNAFFEATKDVKFDSQILDQHPGVSIEL